MLTAFFVLSPLAVGALFVFAFFADRYFRDSASPQESRTKHRG